METALTFAEYIDLLHGLAGCIVGGFFIYLVLKYI